MDYNFDYGGEFREKLIAILGESDKIDAIMALVQERVDVIEDNHHYDVLEAVERAAGDY